MPCAGVKSAPTAAPPSRSRRRSRYCMIGSFFNQTLPSSIGGDAMRLWLVGRGPAGWKAAAYSIFVDRAIGLIALAVLIVASLPWSYRLIGDPQGRLALLFVDFAALAAAGGFPGSRQIALALARKYLGHTTIFAPVRSSPTMPSSIASAGGRFLFCRCSSISSPS